MKAVEMESPLTPFEVFLRNYSKLPEQPHEFGMAAISAISRLASEFFMPASQAAAMHGTREARGA
jgi:hypothetical protein